MTISSPHDFRPIAKRKLPPFLFHYIDGGANQEQTLESNCSDISKLLLKQRVLRDVSNISTSIDLFGESLAMPVTLAPVGLTGMYARRGEVQAAQAAQSAGIPFTMSTMSVCPIEEVAPSINRPMWFQLYVLKDRGFMKHALDRAKQAGVSTLVFTVDLPIPGARYRDRQSGMSGDYAQYKRILQAALHPQWAYDVGIKGKPHDLGNVSAYLGSPTGLADFMGWIASNFDPTISWQELQWIRDYWQGPMVIKGILDPDDARQAVALGADGIVVSNHGGRQLDSVMSSATALPAIADAVKGDTKIIIDSGVRSGIDVVKLLALGADCTMIGRSFVYALAAQGRKGVEHLLQIYKQEMEVAMSLNGVTRISEINQDCLV